MLKKLSISAILSLFVAAFALAQPGLTGTWEGETPGGTAILLTLKAQDTALAGTLKRGEEETSPITDGKISKNTFAFKATLNGQTEALSGEHAGDEIKVWLDRQGPEKAITLRRAKAKGK